MAGSPAPPIPHCRDLTSAGQRLAATLYHAHSERLERGVTVTVYPTAPDAGARDRFDTAARTAQRLAAHPSVVAVHDWGFDPEGRPWVVTDPQPAETLDTWLRSRGPVSVEEALRVGVLVAGALETAHRAGVVHGDLSPARLVVGPQGEPLVADIGLAEFATFPGLGALYNPVRYHAPPEVLERTAVSPASDVYSLATTVYALLTGRAPHEKPADITDSNASLLLRILQIEVPPIVRPDLPAGLENALRDALADAPTKRPQRALDLAWSLQDVQRRAGLAATEPVVLDLSGGQPDPRLLPPAPRSTPASRLAPAERPAPPAPPPGAGPSRLEPDASPPSYTEPLPPEDPPPEGSGAGERPDLVDLFSRTPPDLPAPWARRNGAHPHARPGPDVDRPSDRPPDSGPRSQPLRRPPRLRRESPPPGPATESASAPSTAARRAPGYPAGSSTRPGSALDRARQARRLGHQPQTAGTTPATSRPRRQGADAPEAGPPALPVIVLIVVVVLLTLAVAYLIISDGGVSDGSTDDPQAVFEDFPAL
ncbi:MAG TPA: protein kinase [Acidimicrobiales bacterium]|nr:protein kinase [Acidimicrobiales bacterium]